MQRRLYHFSGRVQGVGFRYTVQNIAMRYDVAGHVKNLPDGRVEMLVEGSESDIDRLVDEVNAKMDGFIEHVDRRDSPATGEFKQFRISH